MLEKCPLCGSNVVEAIEFNRDYMTMNIHCSECGCELEDNLSSEKRFLNSYDVITFIQEFENHWNTRA